MYESILNTVDNTLNTLVIDMFGNIATAITPTLTLMMTLTIILYGLSMMQGWIEVTLKAAIKHVVMALVVYIFATNVGIFTSILYELMTNVPAQLVTTILGSTGESSTNINDLIGNIYDQGIEASQYLLLSTPWNAFGMKIIGLLVAFSTVLLCGYAAFLIIMAKIAVAVLLGIAPIFIALAMFGGTRGIFEGWLRQLINFAIIPLITYTIMFVCVQILQVPVQEMTNAGLAGNLSSLNVIPYVFASFICFLLLLQVMGIAAGIAGGMTIGTMGAASAIGGNVSNRMGGFGKKAGDAGKAGIARLKGMRANKITN